jgi:hypothetical protein
MCSCCEQRVSGHRRKERTTPSMFRSVESVRGAVVRAGSPPQMDEQADSRECGARSLRAPHQAHRTRYWADDAAASDAPFACGAVLCDCDFGVSVPFELGVVPVAPPALGVPIPAPPCPLLPVPPAPAPAPPAPAPAPAPVPPAPAPPPPAPPPCATAAQLNAVHATIAAKFFHIRFMLTPCSMRLRFR